MNNKKVLKGFNYVATAAAPATITDSNGIVLCELSAGKQGYFVATTETIDVGSAEDVSVVEIRSNFVVPHLTDAGSRGGHVFEEGMIVGIGPGTEYTDIGRYITQGGLFTERTDITVWYGNLPNLVNQHGGSDGGGMFEGCTNMTTFYGNLPSLASGYYMFSGCTSMTTFGSPSRSITINGLAQGMFYNCSSLTSFDIDSINGMTNAQSMFQGCSHLTTFNTTIPSTCTGARYMFYGTGLTSFTVDLPQQLTDMRNMFAFSSNLTTFTSNLHDGCGCQ